MPHAQLEGQFRTVRYQSLCDTGKSILRNGKRRTICASRRIRSWSNASGLGERRPATPRVARVVSPGDHRVYPFSRRRRAKAEDRLHDTAVSLGSRPPPS